MGGGRNSILIFVIKRWLDFQGYEMGGEQLLLRYPNNTGSPGSQPLAAASVPGKKKQPEGWAHLCLFIYLFDQRESRLYFSQSSICLCVCVCFFPLAWVYLCYNWFSGRCVCLFSIFQVCLFVCLYVWGNRMLNSSSLRVSWSVSFCWRGRNEFEISFNKD